MPGKGSNQNIAVKSAAPSKGVLNLRDHLQDASASSLNVSNGASGKLNALSHGKRSGKGSRDQLAQPPSQSGYSRAVVGSSESSPSNAGAGTYPSMIVAS